MRIGTEIKTKINMSDLPAVRAVVTGYDGKRFGVSGRGWWEKETFNRVWIAA